VFEGLNSSPAQLTGALWICESGVKIAAQSMISQYKYIYYTGSKCVKSNGSKGVNHFYKKGDLTFGQSRMAKHTLFNSRN